MSNEIANIQIFNESTEEVEINKEKIVSSSWKEDNYERTKEHTYEMENVELPIEEAVFLEFKDQNQDNLVQI